MDKLRELIQKLFEEDDSQEFPLSRFLDDQRRAIPGDYNDLDEVCGGSHDVIRFTQEGMEDEKVDQILAEMDQALDNLQRSSSPRAVSWQFSFEAAREMVEARFFRAFYGFLTGKHTTIKEIDLSKLTYEGMDVSPQAWLFGLVDALSEYAKAHRDWMNSRKLAIQDKANALLDLIDFVHTAYEILYNYMSTPSGVMDAYSRRGWMNTFRGKLGKIADLIERLKDRYSALLDQIDGNTENKAEMARQLAAFKDWVIQQFASHGVH